MASAYTLNIFIINTDSGCTNTTISSQIVTTACTEEFLIRISQYSDAQGPFNVYTGSTSTTAIFSGKTRTQMIDGVQIIVNNNDPIC
jgi:hypothetical protein